MPIDVFAFQNENSYTAYPLDYSSELFPSPELLPLNFLTDANFIQFDGFIPILQSLEINSTAILLTIKFDLEVVVVTLLFSGFAEGTTVKAYGTNSRYLGKLIFGNGALTLWTSFLNRNIDLNIPFLASVVRPISSSAGVYSIEGVIGAVTLAHDDNIFYDETGNNITLNAVGQLTPVVGNVLKTINGVAPVDNAIFISGSDLIRIYLNGDNSLTFAVAGPNVNITPTLLT